MEFVDHPNLLKSSEATCMRLLQEKYFQLLLEQSLDGEVDANRINALLQSTKFLHLNAKTVLSDSTSPRTFFEFILSLFR